MGAEVLNGRRTGAEVLGHPIYTYSLASHPFFSVVGFFCFKQNVFVFFPT
jgi:hypothetical protein